MGETNYRDSDCRKAYKEMLDVFEKHSEALVGDSYLDVSDRLKMLLNWEDVFDKFGFSVHRSKLYSHEYAEISQYERLSFYSKENKRQLSWPDDGNQPEKEWLYSVQFSSGAYIFSSDYPTKTFNKFFDELKSFKPKYADTVNHCLYFDETNAIDVHNNLKALFDKYKDEVADEVNQLKIDELNRQIESIRAQS